MADSKKPENVTFLPQKIGQLALIKSGSLSKKARRTKPKRRMDQETNLAISKAANQGDPVLDAAIQEVQRVCNLRREEVERRLWGVVPLEPGNEKLLELARRKGGTLMTTWTLAHEALDLLSRSIAEADGLADMLTYTFGTARRTG